MIKRMVLGWMCTLALTVVATDANAASHCWRFNEIYSNADGSVIFVEMMESCGNQNETSLGGKWILSNGTMNQYVFPSNLPCSDCTADKFLLVASQGFADLPGAPTPDYIIPEALVPLFDVAGDTLEYWTYGAAEWSFGLPVPTDGLNSLHHAPPGADFIAVNSPTNFAGESGSIDLSCPADLDGSGDVAIGDLLQLLAAWGPCDGCPEDLDGGGGVAINDLLILLSAWGPC